ncbi:MULTISPECIES: LysR substrate-binding domain-containing protein [unclassified Caballeronia]|uniref:LysR substrate-binding domain-containing protein n=1 Tax=unclassified Caballeronia TaxID=2646786 RepID=UPI002866FCFF|nr:MULTISPECIES: LysR substrate-binding domain-containing protein [unclassified Caballeronia]MDR5754692.1 LysR substrate-binding domain-containing protein [Caballeronia sp. LZ024]MDR5839806.1 LysR substrate-binding domain-containing protein [Caballeronia sp. LZ031]
MKYHQLRAFLTVAEQGSIRAAARSLHLSQAALTKALKEIEQDLGVPLVLRTARGVQLTAFGQQLRIRAQLVVSEMRRAEDDIAQMKGAAAGSVSAAVTPAAALAILPQAYRAFRREMPNARVSFVEGFPGVALPRLRDGTLDFVVAVIVPEHLGPEFDHIELYESHSVVVAREDHPLKDCTSLAALSEAEWLLNSSPESSTRALLDLFGDLGYAVPQRVVECPSFVIAHGLLRGSDMLAAMPAPLLEHPWVGDGLAVLPIVDRLPAISVGVVTRRDSPLTPAASLLLDCLQRAVRGRT